MPLFYEIPDSLPYPEPYGMACFYTAEKLKAPKQLDAVPYCYCNLSCDVSEKVFYSNDGDSRKNDKTQYIATKSISSDTIIFELWKNGKKLGNISNTYGTYWASFGVGNLYTGYEIEWKKVNTAHGTGRYNIKQVSTIIGITTTVESRTFELMLYSDILADKTVKIESWQTGNIIGSPFNFENLRKNGWLQQYRIKGFFGEKSPVLELDNYMNPQYEHVQIQAKIIKEYTLRSKYINAEVANDLFYTNMLANKILITDYNILNNERFTQVDLIPIEPTSVNYSKLLVKHEWKFKERIENFVKTNY